MTHVFTYENGLHYCSSIPIKNVQYFKFYHLICQFHIFFHIIILLQTYKMLFLRNIGIVFNGTDFHRARDAFVLNKINIYCRQARQGMRLGALSSDFSL